MNEVLMTLGLIWLCTFVMSFMANSAQKSNDIKMQQRAEKERRRKVDQLYGRE